VNPSSSAGRRASVAERARGWGARFARSCLRRPSARDLDLGLVLALAAAPGCLLDPLKIGPGDEFSDDGSSSTEAESDSSSSESESSSSSSESESSSDESESDTTTSESDTSESDTSETETETSETDTGDDSCGPQGALPEDACETILGYYWDGGACVALEGCSCDDDCPLLFEAPVDCWLANQACGPSPCAGLDEASCLVDELCAARYARPLALDIDVVCVGAESIYAGCGLATSCAAVVSYACPVLDPDDAHQFASACLPELDWLPCDPPQLDPIPDCP
jgi:hypothetical protein